ncbi:carbohydrate kinase family protein [Flavobacterium pectinovorum]|uniref:carbohydrate kinase family protein n=1 Tax=Flavobacterium pectinovorum TaxID=29533 RepID=UPI001FAD9260|nr:carbohydrate kinase [Flavobacterium pectinovorum]MCI9844036.1 carbohydrate kinase [Flavobacterium pectinovorum]
MNKSDEKIKAVAFGEILWDVFENEKKIGGAPLNVALRMKSLGCEVSMISSVGNDENGDVILREVETLGIETNTILQLETYPTGLVNVTLDKNGSAAYEIQYPSAWDKIVLDDFAKTLVKDADVLIYGSLVCRDEVSRKSLELLLQNEVYKVFDVNLRKPHYSYEVLEKLMIPANFIKFNDEEIEEIAAVWKSPFTSLEENIQFIALRTNTSSICVTKGKDGALLLWEGKLYKNKGYAVRVADTVGAGDSFLASLITSLLAGKSPQMAIDFACAVGALVAASSGANPKISSVEIEKLISGN